jgi:hypothetical protein
MKPSPFLPAMFVLALSPLVAAAQAASPANMTSPAPLVAALDAAPAASLYKFDPPAPSYSSSSAPALFDEPTSDTPGQSSYSSQPVSRATPAKTESTGARPFSGLAAAFRIGSGGIGFDVATPLVRRRLNLRGGADFFSYNTTFTIDSLSVVGALKLQHGEAMVDWFPFRGAFRISGGMAFSNQTAFNATLVPTPGQTFTVNNVDYYSQPASPTLNPAGPITGTGTFAFGGNTAPRLTMGWGNMLKEKGHIGFQSEFGVEFISTPTVVYNISGTGCQNYNGQGVNNAANYSNCGPIPQTNVTAEQASIQSDVNGFRFFPIFSVGLSYKFFLKH